MRLYFSTLIGFFLTAQLHAQATDKVPEGFLSLFNGKDLTNWKIPAGDNGHWKVLDDVLDYDAESEAKESKDLWSAKEYKDFE